MVMDIKKITKCTGKILAKTALFSGGMACDIISQMPDIIAAKQKGEKPPTPERESNCCSRWLYEKAKNIKITE